MWLGKKSAVRSTKAWDSEQPWVDKMAAPIAGQGIKLQQAVAGHMSRLAGRLSLKSCKTALVAFCLLGGGFSGYLIITAICGPSGSITRFKVEAVQIPKNVGKDPEDSVGPNSFAAIHMAQKIRAFQMYIDSLQKAAPSLYDSFHMNKHGPMDSLHRIEKKHSSQP